MGFGLGDHQYDPHALFPSFVRKGSRLGIFSRFEIGILQQKYHILVQLIDGKERRAIPAHNLTGSRFCDVIITVFGNGSPETIIAGYQLATYRVQFDGSIVYFRRRDLGDP